MSKWFDIIPIWPYKLAVSAAPAPAPASAPAYRALANELRSAVLQGRYPAGVALPTEAELVAERGLSRQTVRRAFQELVAEGVVTRSPGRGTFAADRERTYLRQFGSVEELMGLSADTELEVVDPLTTRVDVTAASRLRADADTVVALTFLRRHGGQPFCFTETVFPPQVGEILRGIPELATPGARSSMTIIGALDSRLPDPIASADQSITAVGASGAVARALHCQTGTPLLRIDRVYFDRAGTAIELAISYFLPDTYSYRVKLARTVH